jgi:hypothetical protein
MNWNYLIAPGCLLLGCLITLFSRESARTVAKEEFREQIGASLAVFKGELLTALDERYRLGPECALLMASLRDRVNLRMDFQDRQERKNIARIDDQERHMEYIDREREKGK